MAKVKRKGLIWIIIAVVVIAGGGIAFMSSEKEAKNERSTVDVKKQNIVDKALAVGSIEPLNEIAVKSKISGVAGQMFVDVGDYVEKGMLMLEVKPDPTPLELAEAKRNIEMQSIVLKTFKREYERNQELQEKGFISDQELENIRMDYEEAALRLQIANERLDLLEKGKIRIADAIIETVIKAPISGYILEKSVNVGDPVVPLTSYQAGTELMKMANMELLIFKGTVDEIDVGKISEGLKAELDIGALPEKNVKGHVSLISLKAQKVDNTTVFPVEILIDDASDARLRAGFSANAHIIIARKDSVLAIPERVVTFRNDSAFVMIPKGEEESEEVYIETGLSDAITIEVESGLEEGDKVLEKKVHEIT